MKINFERKNKNFQSGFTLVEVLVVVGIIGLLASVVLVGLGTFRMRSRDARRIADLREVQNALELYYTKNNEYPAAATTWDAFGDSLIGAEIGVNSIPNDPKGDRDYEYGVNTEKQSYVLKAVFEDKDSPALKDDADGDIFGINCGTVDNTDSFYCVRF